MVSREEASLGGCNRKKDELRHIPSTPLLLSFLLLVLSSVSSSPGEDVETVQTSNAALLNRLGLVPLVLASGHQRKRLAESFGSSHLAPQSRHSGSAKDSHVYVVKLPPAPPYYSFVKPHHEEPENNSNVDPGFKNNGKPAKIYHWNLPLLKRINEKKKQLALAKIEHARKRAQDDKKRLKFEQKVNYLKKIAQQQLVNDELDKPSRNNDKWLSDPAKSEPRNKINPGSATKLHLFGSSEKSYRVDSESHQHHPLQDHHKKDEHQKQNWNEESGNDAPQEPKPKKHRKKAAITYYYAPEPRSAAGGISKHFANNGKPKAFYVMEKSRKPVYYHQLLP
ncbi:hypothetical protein QAD02_008997 [Eretmocerus hayati]|uniref:Uncharacterized protein n=1 Tax=Eretmocerus hayati TaxID=131215 RepID=A0ACC2NCH4_9HYME|nr:hypothetical protein QAD02_008997 [Eretmocerus hayati]